MSVRFEDCVSEVSDLAAEIIAEHFPELRNVKVTYLYDLKKRISNGKVVLGRCQKTNDLIKHFTIDDADDEDGYRYIVYLDQCAWDNIVESDKIRLLRHELRHILIDEEAKQPFKIAPHDIEDFAEEIELNSDDVRWAERVAGLAEQIYSQRRDQEETEEEIVDE